MEKKTTKVLSDAIIESFHQFRYIVIAPCKGIRVRNSGNFCLWNAESGIWEIFAYGIRNPRL